MSDKDLELLLELAEEKLKSKVSKEEAMQSFVAAGILNQDGAYTDPYKQLETAGS
jgi:hypothetical protein